jgi:hypothetical protein
MVCSMRRILRRLVSQLRFPQGFRGLFVSCPLRCETIGLLGKTYCFEVEMQELVEFES